MEYQRMTTTKTKAILYVALPGDYRQISPPKIQQFLDEEQAKWTTHFPDLDLLAVPDYTVGAITRVVNVG